MRATNKLTYLLFGLKVLGHAILGNFSTDQIVKELTKNIKIMAQNYRRTLDSKNTGKTRMDKTGED